MSFPARMAGPIHPYQDRTYSVNRHWILLVAITDQRALPAKEAIVPQVVLTVQLRPLHPPPVQPLIYLPHHTLKTRKEIAVGVLQAHTGASQILMDLGTRSGRIERVRHLLPNQRPMRPAVTSRTHWKQCAGKKAPQITAVLRLFLHLWYRTSLILWIDHFLRQILLPKRWCRARPP